MDLNKTKFKFSFVDFKPKAKPKNNTSSKKKLTPLITCIAVRKDDKWFANIADQNLNNISDKEIPFTEQSFDLRGRIVVFSLEKDEHNHYIQYWRSPFEAMVAPHTSTKLCSLCDKHRFSGYIVKDDNGLRFDMKEYIQ